MNPPAATLSVQYFDGRVAQAQPAVVCLREGMLQVLAPNGQLLREAPVREVQWPERQRHGQRQAGLPGGGLISAPDAGAWDDWAQAAGVWESPVVRVQQSWRGAGVALALAVAVMGAVWLWGVPWAAQRVVKHLPPELAAQAGDATLRALERAGLAPSRLPHAQQVALREQWGRLQQRAYPGRMLVQRIEFRHSGRSRLGPNALALPDGVVVVTDELVDLLHDRPDVLMGVLGHEAGHVLHQHGLRQVVQAGLVTAMAGLVVGDFSSVLAGIPAALAHSGYSRDMEREADQAAVDLLRANGLSPRLMVTLFERLETERRRRHGGDEDAPDAWAAAIASHPSDTERTAFFDDAARR